MFLLLHLLLIFMESESANKQCREVQSVNGMAVQGFVYKMFSVRAFHECNIEREIICQSCNYVIAENSCGLNNRSEEPRPEHFHSDPARVYLGHLSSRGLYI